MADADGLLPWEVLPEDLLAQPAPVPARLQSPQLGGERVDMAPGSSSSSSGQSTPRGSGALFDFKELDLRVAQPKSQAAADDVAGREEDDASAWESVELHPEGLQCVVVCTDWVSVYTAPRKGSKKLGTLKEGSSVTVYEVRDSWARHNYSGAGGRLVAAWSTMYDSEESCLIRRLSELTDEERWIFGDFSALALPQPEAAEAEVERGSGSGSCSTKGIVEDDDTAEDPQTQPREGALQEESAEAPALAPGAPPVGGHAPISNFEIDLLGLIGVPVDPSPASAQKPGGRQRVEGSSVDGDSAAFADIPPDGLPCIVVCRSWVPVRLAPTYWSKMVGGIKVGNHVTVYEVAEMQWARHEFSTADGVQIAAWSSIRDPQHGKLIRPLASVPPGELEVLRRLREGHGASKPGALEPGGESLDGPGAPEPRRPSPGVGGPTLLEALGLGLAALGVTLHAGPGAARALRAASRDVGSAVAELVPVVQRWCPSSLYVCGGFISTQEGAGSNAYVASHSAERLHPVTGAWEPLPRMLQRRAGAAAAAVAGRVYVCGGSDGAVELRTAERFDPLGAAWEPIAHMSQRRDCAAAANVNNRLYVCGGSRSGLRAAMIEDAAECFDPQVGAWAPVPSMLEKRVGPAAASLGGRLYVCGGMEGADDLRSVEQLDPASPEPVWEALPPMKHTRYGAAAAAVAGKLYVCGGTVSAVAVRSVECFDPALRVWRGMPEMSGCRSCTAAASVAGQLYVVGGKAGRLCLGSVELFDPAARAWRAVAPMLQGRRGAAAAAAGGPLHLRLWPGALDELSEEQLRIVSMWEDYNRRAAVHLRDNAG